jgi:GT2 family glycosyltransferase
MQPLPLVSVIIVTWNSKKYLPTCLDKLSTQTFHHFEVILIDNGSEDGTLHRLQAGYKNLHLSIEKLASNYGFAAANNLGARLAHGKWLALLNADAFPDPDWLEQLLFAAQKNPEFTFFSSRQIQFNRPDLLDGAGDEYHVSGLAWRKYYNHTEKEYGTQPDEVFSACAAASFYLRDDFLKVNGFDEAYFSYFEDVDLSFRLRLAGGRCLYVPQATVHHVGSASSGKMSDFVIYHGHRNLVWTYFKNMPSWLLWFYLPLHILMNIYFVFSFAFKGKGRAILMAKWDALRGIPSILQKRRNVQKSRSISISEIYRIMEKGLLSPYWASRQRKLFSRQKP